MWKIDLANALSTLSLSILVFGPFLPVSVALLAILPAIFVSAMADLASDLIIDIVKVGVNATKLIRLRILAGTLA